MWHATCQRIDAEAAANLNVPQLVWVDTGWMGLLSRFGCQTWHQRHGQSSWRLMNGGCPSYELAMQGGYELNFCSLIINCGLTVAVLDL